MNRTNRVPVGILSNARKRRGLNVPAVTLKTIGVVTIIVAALGLLYNLVSIPSILTGYEHDPDMPYFLPVFLMMSAICIACYMALGFCGVKFFRLRTEVFKLFVGVIAFEVLYYFSIGALWLVPNLGMSVAAATGVSSGGLMFQGIVLFPLWAPAIAYWAIRSMAVDASTAVAESVDLMADTTTPIVENPLRAAPPPSHVGTYSSPTNVPESKARVTVNWIWSGLLLLLATLLILMALAMIGSSFWSSTRSIPIASSIFGLMLGLPGVWCAYRGIRGIWNAGRIPGAEEAIQESAVAPSPSSKLITVGGRLFLGAMLLGMMAMIVLNTWEVSRYQRGAGTSDGGLETTAIVAFTMSAIMVSVAGLGLAIMVTGLVMRGIDWLVAVQKRA